jgi:acetyl esterase/lipase
MESCTARASWRFLVVVAGLLALPACRIPDVSLWGPGRSAEALCSVQRITDIDYSTEPAEEPFRHQLDLYLPKGVKNFPIVVFVHGGAWMIGDNRCCGLYASIGEFFASHGIGAVLPNYRLSPGVKHPAHVEDIARAFAWTHAHIGEYGGRADQLFLAGHSAGGHLVALLATDERYLKAEGRSVADIQGVIAVSGVYRIPPGKVDVQFGGNDALSLRLDQAMPFRVANGVGPTALASGGIPLHVNIYGPVFGSDSERRADASPINHVRRGSPPFVMFRAEHDLPTLPEMAEEFHAALREHGCDAQLLCVPDRNHNSVMFMASEPGDPVGRGMLDFIRRRLPE